MLVSSLKRKYPHFPLLSYFSVFVCLRCLLHHILLLIAYTFQENREFVFIIVMELMMSANSLIRFGLNMVFVYLYITPSHYHHCADLSEDFELIKRLSDILIECVSKIKHIHSIIHYTICGVVCFQFTHFPCDDWVNIYVLCLIIIIKLWVWTITHCLGLRHETLVCAVCLSVFFCIYVYMDGHVYTLGTTTNIQNFNEETIVSHTANTINQTSIWNQIEYFFISICIGIYVCWSKWSGAVSWPKPFFLYWTCYDQTPLCHIDIRNWDILHGNFIHCNQLPLWYLMPVINHLVPCKMVCFLEIRLNDRWLVSMT